MTGMLHIGNLLYLLAYSVRDILWLRVITIVATLFMMPYYYGQETPLVPPIIWCTLFTVVNVVQVVLLLLERRPVNLDEEELRLYRTVFRGFKPQEFAKLLSIAEWKRADTGQALLLQNKPTPSLMLVARGFGKVENGGKCIANISPGQFVGEMGFLTGQPASANVVAVEPTEYLSWPIAKLRTMLNTAPQLHVKLQSVLGADLVAKLRADAATQATASGLMVALRNVGAE